MEVDDAWPWKILWSDEAHFYLDGAVNTQNYRIWGTSPPNILNQQPLHSDYVTAWCGYTAEFLSSDLFSLKLPLHKFLKDALCHESMEQ
ncbi:zinc finger MYM-type protein 1 [Trichonephila clavipes]|nr:zinc finger MYM-type protein 1 [Trichonephila clavipes]